MLSKARRLNQQKLIYCSWFNRNKKPFHQSTALAQVVTPRPV